MNKHVVAAMSAAVALALPGAAGASTASATLTDLHLQLIDLDPTDGVTPSIQFQDVQGGSLIAAESGTSAAHQTDLRLGGSVFGGASSNAVDGVASASASLSGDPLTAFARALVSATATQRGTYGAASVWLGDGSSVVTFTLSPETRLVITADASASAMSTVDDPAADTWASIYLRLSDYTGLGSVSDGGARAEQFSTGGATPSELVDERQVAISFDNATSASLGGIFQGQLDVSVSDVPLAVPEPAGAALMLSALAAGLARARRRRGA